MARRLDAPEKRDLYATLSFERHDQGIHFHMKDPGDGFVWDPYLHIDANRLLDPHGKGIAISMAICFDRLEYHEPGNEVTAIIQISRQQQRRLGTPTLSGIRIIP